MGFSSKAISTFYFAIMEIIKTADNFNKNIEVSNIIYSHLELQSTILKKKDYG